MRLSLILRILVVLISVFFDFRVYKAFVNTEIKEHGIIIIGLRRSFAGPFDNEKSVQTEQILTPPATRHSLV